MGMAGFLKAPGKGLAFTIPNGCKAFNALRMWLSGRLPALTLGSISRITELTNYISFQRPLKRPNPAFLLLLSFPHTPRKFLLHSSFLGDLVLFRRKYKVFWGDGN